MVWELLRLSPLCRGHIHHNHHQYPLQLSNESPGRGVPSLIVISTIFQADINFRFSIFAYLHLRWLASLPAGESVCSQEGGIIQPTAKLPWQPQRNSCGKCLEHVIPNWNLSVLRPFFLQNVLKNCIAIAVPCHPFLLGHYYCSFFSQTQFCLSIYVYNIFIKYLIIRSFS